MIRSAEPRKFNRAIIIVVLPICVAIFVYAYQQNRDSKSTTKNKPKPHATCTDKLVSVASLELIDSGRKVTAWFFETPQVFSFSLDAPRAQKMYNLLEEARQKHFPVHVCSRTAHNTNVIRTVTRATEEEISRYNVEKKKNDQRKPPLQVSPPTRM